MPDESQQVAGSLDYCFPRNDGWLPCWRLLRYGLPGATPPRAIRRSDFDELENDTVRIPEAAELEVAEAWEV